MMGSMDLSMTTLCCMVSVVCRSTVTLLNTQARSLGQVVVPTS